MKKIDYLMEIFKLLVNFIYLLLSGMAFLGYNLFFVKENRIIFIIFLGIGFFLLSLLLLVLKLINNEILKSLKE